MRRGEVGDRVAICGPVCDVVELGRVHPSTLPARLWVMSATTGGRPRVGAATSSSASGPRCPFAWPRCRAAPSCGPSAASFPSAARRAGRTRCPPARAARTTVPRRAARAPCSRSAPRSPWPRASASRAPRGSPRCARTAVPVWATTPAAAYPTPPFLGGTTQAPGRLRVERRVLHVVLGRVCVRELVHDVHAVAVRVVDLHERLPLVGQCVLGEDRLDRALGLARTAIPCVHAAGEDRKSTRLNSSHEWI